MQIAMIDGCTRVCGKSQGFLGLPIRDYKLDNGQPVMLSAWTPTPDEIAAIVAGANIIVSIWGTSPPPMMLTVGSVPE